MANGGQWTELGPEPGPPLHISIPGSSLSYRLPTVWHIYMVPEDCISAAQKDGQAAL